MKAAQSALLVLLALTALVAVASAYEPIADNKVAAAKVPTQAASRKLLQGAHATTSPKSAAAMGTKPNILWAGYLIQPPFWVVGMESMRTDEPNIETERLFTRVNQ